MVAVIVVTISSHFATGPWPIKFACPCTQNELSTPGELESLARIMAEWFALYFALCWLRLFITNS